MEKYSKTIYSDDRTFEVDFYEPKDARYAVQIIHGMSEHKGRYKDFVKFLCDKGCLVVIYNQRGHDDEKGDIGSFSLLMQEAVAVSKFLPTDLPKILIGHSMGSIIARRLMERNLFENYILIGTGNKSGLIDGISAKALGVISKFLPNEKSKIINYFALRSHDKKVDGTLNNRWLTRDETNVQSYNDDPESGHLMSNASIHDTFVNLQKSLKISQLSQIMNQPKILLVGGKEDPFSNFGKDIKRLGELYSRVSDDVTVQLYEEMRHEVLGETEKYVVYDNIFNWIEHNV